MGAVEDFERNAPETARRRLALLAAFLAVWIGVCLYFTDEPRKSDQLKMAAVERKLNAAEPDERP